MKPPPPTAANKDAAPRSPFAFRPLTPARWADFEALFGERGACGGCWCMAWRLPSREWNAGKTGGGNRRAMKRLVASGATPGILAYRGKEAVGWCAVAPRRDYVYLTKSKALAPVDDAKVWSVSCFFIRKDARGAGLSLALLHAACAYAAQRGAKIVEGYPFDYEKPPPSAFVWTGLPSVFRRAGFEEVLRRSPSRPIVRKTVVARVKEKK